jgi:hypothetical protein
MRSHTGAVLTLGQGALMSMSLKQKINTKSGTEAELVGVDNAMNFVEWIQLFVEQQVKSIYEEIIGCDVVIQQDNISTIYESIFIKTSALDYNGERYLSSIINCVIFRL